MPMLHAEDTSQEKDFKARFEAFLKSDDVAVCKHIC